MKTLKKINILLLVLVTTLSCAQNKKMKTEVDKIKELGKDAIIQLALDITHAKIDTTNFEVITISVNHEDVYVSFTNPVQYIPLNKKLTTSFTVAILSKTTSYNSVTNPSDYKSPTNERIFYKPNTASEKAIQFVFDAINKSKEIGNTSLETLDSTITIKEKETYYEVLVVSNTQESNYKVKKKTGEIYDITHAHLEIPMPLEEGEEKMQDLTSYFREQINAKAGINSEILKKTDLHSEITYQTLSKMDRDALINLAKSKVDTYLKLLKEEPFNYSDIDVEVLKNSKTFIVYFKQNFKYVPLHTAHYYGFYVNLLDDDIEKLRNANEVDDEVNASYNYYVPSKKDLKKIAFVKKAINWKPGHHVVVREKENHYELTYETSGEKVDKKTGKVYDFWDRIYAPEEDPLVEILADTCPTQKELKK